MQQWVVVFQAANADMRLQPYAGLFNAESASQAIESCKIAHGKQPGYQLLVITQMKK